VQKYPDVGGICNEGFLVVEGKAQVPPTSDPIPWAAEPKCALDNAEFHAWQIPAYPAVHGVGGPSLQRSRTIPGKRPGSPVDSPTAAVSFGVGPAP
jgi:hypothetical protein